jgi:hypothetical protein
VPAGSSRSFTNFREFPLCEVRAQSSLCAHHRLFREISLRLQRLVFSRRGGKLCSASSTGRHNRPVECSARSDSENPRCPNQRLQHMEHIVSASKACGNGKSREHRTPGNIAPFVICIIWFYAVWRIGTGPLRLDDLGAIPNLLSNLLSDSEKLEDYLFPKLSYIRG